MLKLEDVQVYWGEVHALKGISLDVKEGELVSLLGSNGAGKSTTLMTISGIVKPRAGRVVFEGHDLTSRNSFDIVHLGIIQSPEGRRIFSGLTVYENLLMGATRRKDRQHIAQDIERIVALFPVLGERLRQNGATLSGGEQQMLAIARSLMADPRLLMLDEPSLGLAPVIVEVIFDVIQQLHREGVTILLVEQNARQALQIADRCYVLETGRVVMSGQADDLRANPEVQRFYLGG